jgi:hypothetical protein
MKSYVEEYMQTIYQDRFTIVTGQLRVGKRIIRYAGAACLNEEDKSNKDIGKNLATARAMENLSNQLDFIAKKMKAKTYKQIRNNVIRRNDNSKTTVDYEIQDTENYEGNEDIYEFESNDIVDSIVDNNRNSATQIRESLGFKPSVNSALNEIKDISNVAFDFVDQNEIAEFLGKPSYSEIGRRMNVASTTVKTWQNKIYNYGFDSLTTFAKLRILSIFTDGVIKQDDNKSQEIKESVALNILQSDTLNGVGRRLGITGDTVKAWIKTISNKGFLFLSPFAQNLLNEHIADITDYMRHNNTMQNHLAE